MVVQFISAYPAHTLAQIYDMPSQVFFLYYKKIPALQAIQRVQHIESEMFSEAKKWADKGNKHKIDREYNKLLKLAEGR